MWRLYNRSLKKNKKKYDYIVYCRSDLYFLKKVNLYSLFNHNLICTGDKSDRLAFIPRKYLNDFFFERYNVYINNKKKFNNDFFFNMKDVYFKTINNKFYFDNNQDTRIMRPNGLSSK